MESCRQRWIRILRWPWVTPHGLAFLFLTALLFVLLQIPGITTNRAILAALLGVYLVTGLALLAHAVGRASELRDAHNRAKAQAAEAECRARAATERLEAIYQVSERLVRAGDENEIIDLALKLSVETVGALGASFVPLDEHGHPQAAVNYGELPFPVIPDWVEYLASPGVRNRCKSCETHGTTNLDRTCPLLRGPFATAAGLFCLPVRRGEREFGVLNLFVPEAFSLDGPSQAFLRTLTDETALILESVRLRRQELEAFQHLQTVREKTDPSTLLSGLLEDVRFTLEADFAVLWVIGEDPKLSTAVVGDVPERGKGLVERVLQEVIRSGHPVDLGAGQGDMWNTWEIRSLLAVPLVSMGGEPAGGLLVGNCSGEIFHQRQLALLQTVAGQVSLLLQNAKAMAQLEYQIVLQERTRLAREIHDGLAQTLGYLKLQAAQLRNYLDRNELDRLRNSADLCYAALSDVYLDVREAIDGLRISPSGGFSDWIDQIAMEFEETSGLPVQQDVSQGDVDLPPEVHAQLVRIVQEALTNVRKHAQATRVKIRVYTASGILWLEVLDDGIGFSPEDVPGTSQHGLRGMRERSDLIGADFQIISRPGGGTTVRIHLPLPAVASNQPSGIEHPGQERG